MSPATPGDGAAAAETVLRLAVMLQAGVAPAPAWHHLAASQDPAAERVTAAVADGMPLPRAIAASGGAWRDVAVAWHVATTVGAPLAESLRGLAAALRDAAEAADDVRVALAEPAGTARLMGWLPLVAVGLGVALGFDTLGVLVGHPAGIACLVAGGALILAAQRWTARLVRRARADSGVPGLHAELVAIALSGGASIDRATAVVRDAHAAAGTRNAADADADVDADADADVDAVLALSRSAGVPAVELLRASAAHARHRARVDGRLRAARLSSRLLIPLGVCTLPAFLLLGVAPMLLSVVSTMSLSL
ncbi:type II secretion system F family protein [Microbacterium cremeum]|uniref:type II secretion system F family protein n=1 Tax=Microbacterium cremeum TaxID=2782169 RepID=UPI001887721A|nr:type II secretion system F family protein [Microbacterium cremeum]